MPQQQQKARVDITIDRAQVMTKILVSCVIAPLYENSASVFIKTVFKATFGFFDTLNIT